MMKGVKDEENLMRPLFPRLHIKNAEQGGPKAPPRNKMALYEQLSIPSQKFTSGLASMSPFTPINSCNTVPSASSTHGGGQKRSLYSPICDSPPPCHLAKRLHSHSSDVMNLHATSINLEWKPMKHAMHHPLDSTYCSLFQPQSIPNCKNSSTKGVQKGNASMLEGESCFSPTRGDNCRNHNKVENVTECCEDHCGNADVSDKSVVDSMSGVEILPDDVVRVIGQKQFLKTRRAIVHQQRVFAVQVFELHRLIKVQKLFAASPELLLQNEIYLGNSSIKALPRKKSPSLNLLEAPQPLTSKLKPQKQNQTKPPLFSLSNHSNTILDTQQSSFYVHSPPGNQWLLPILSPSEGLVYKPYTGLTPPTSGFGVPVYGITTATHQEGIGIFPGSPPLHHTYFPPYTMPPIPFASSSAFDVARQLTKSKSHPNGSEEKSYFAGNLQASSGGTDSVAQGDALALFPTDSTVQVSDQASQSCSTEKRTHVIKVVPHNRRLASASAARIFQSIQEERRQYV